MPKQRDKDRRRNRRQAKNKFDNAIAAARNGYYDELEDVEYDEEYIDYWLKYLFCLVGLGGPGGINPSNTQNYYILRIVALVGWT